MPDTPPCDVAARNTSGRAPFFRVRGRPGRHGRSPGRPALQRTRPRSLGQSIAYSKEQALLDIGQREAAAGNHGWAYVQMTGLHDIRPRLRRPLSEAGLRVVIMRPKSVKTRDRLAWIEREGRRADVVIAHPQLVQAGVGFFGKGHAKHNSNSIS